MSFNDSRVIKLVFFPTGGFADQAIRPYRSHLTNESLGRLEEDTAGFKSFSRKAFAGSNILMPDANALGSLHVVNGLRATRFMWWMEVEHMDRRGMSTDRRIQLLTGYTDAAEMTRDGQHIDPRTQMYIDTSMMLREVGSGRSARRNMVSAFNYIPRNANQDDRNQRGEGFTVLRPRDVVNHVGISDYMKFGNDVMDFRSSLNTASITSVIRNNSSSDYLARMFESYRLATSDSEPGLRDLPTVMDTVASSTDDAASMRDKFIQALQRTTSMGDSGAYFSYDELEEAFPHLDEVTHLPEYRAIGAGLHRTGIDAIDDIGFGPNIRDAVEDWNGSSIETTAAHIAATAVPAAMLKVHLTRVSFLVTNDTIDNEIVFKFLAPADTMVSRDVQFDYERACRAFEDEICYYLLPDLARGDMAVSLTMHVDLADADIRMSVSIDGGRARHYAAPMFMLGMNSSVIGNSSQQLDHLATTVRSIFDQIRPSDYGDGDYQDTDGHLVLDSTTSIRDALSQRDTRRTAEASRPSSGDDFGF